MDEAAGAVLVCMDADLQHPPEAVPELVLALSGRPEFAIGTRYGGAELSVDKDWPAHRRLISAAARALARPLSPLSDPMTGFFAIARPAYRRGRARISPVGFKICLESYIKCGCTEAAEVPILFGTRVHGESKLDSKVIVNYLRHLAQLYWHKFGVLFIVFVLFVLLVGLYVLKALFL